MIGKWLRAVASSSTSLSTRLSPAETGHRQFVLPTPLAFALEPRFMFDGAAVATAVDAASHSDAPSGGATADGSSGDNGDSQGSVDAQALTEAAAALSTSSPSHSDNDSSAPPATDTSPAGDAAANPDAAPAVSVTDPVTDSGSPSDSSAAASPATADPTATDAGGSGATKEVAFIESNVADYQTLIDGIKPGVEVVLLDASQDGLSQIAEWAASHSGYDAIHIISHGDEGTLELGSLNLKAREVSSRADDLSTVGSALTTDGEILLYGCDIAAGEDGQALIDSLAAATKADVAASTNITGAASRGGDWILEATAGPINVSALNFADYNNVLAVVNFSSTENSNINNNSLDESVTDGNTATITFAATDTDAGYLTIYDDNDINNGSGDLPGGLYSYSGSDSVVGLKITAQTGYTFDLSAFDYSTDGRATTITITFTSGSTPYSDIYTVDDSSNGSNFAFSSFTHAVNDVTSVTIESDDYTLFQNIQITDIKPIASDTTPPVFDNGPSAQSVSASGFTPFASLDEAGTVYYVVVADGATAPTAAEVKAGSSYGAVTVLAAASSSRLRKIVT